MAMGHVSSTSTVPNWKHDGSSVGDDVPRATLRRILFPTDLSEEADRAFVHARLLAEAFDATLVLYHAADMPQHDEPHWAFDAALEIWCRAERLARQELEDRAAHLTVRHQVLVERKISAHRALVDLIRSTLPDLTVMATHGRAGLSHLFLGSVTEKVVQHGHRPVLCVRGQPAGPPAYRRILVPTDFSPASRRAYPLAALLARTFGAEVIAFHAAFAPTLLALSGVPAQPAPPSEAALWEHFQSDFARVPVTAQIHSGVAWERIVHTSKIEGADLIVMSTRGHDTLGDRILGSNSERVVRHAPCPVLIA
jgi:nucleotide-binding universal stress UspA family protein